MKQWIIECRAAQDKRGGSPERVQVVIDADTPEKAIYLFRGLYHTPKGHITVTPVQVPANS